MTSLDIGVTPLAWPFLGLIALVLPPVLVWSIKTAFRRDVPMLTLFAVSLALVVLAQSVVAFVFAWEMMALGSTFLVATCHEKQHVRRAVLSYLIMSQVGTACIVASLALLAAHAHGGAFSDIARAASSLPIDLRYWALSLALIGFGSKAGLVPLHFWLPSAHPAAPSNASAMLSGAMLSVAVYGLAEFGFSLAAPVPFTFALVVVGLGALSAFVGSLYVAVDSDIKRLLAYSSIENSGISVSVLGLAFAAMSFGNVALAGLALTAVLLHSISHGFFKSLLFLGSGTILHASGTTDLEHLGGLFRTLRLSAPLILLGCMGAAALPPTSGFSSEWLIFRAFIEALNSGPGALRIGAAIVIATLAVAGGLAALGFAKLFGIGFLGDARSPRHAVATVERFDASVGGLALLALMLLAVGLIPRIVLVPLDVIARAITSARSIDVGALPTLPAAIALLPLVGAAASIAYARLRKVRVAETWSCGSQVTPRSQYTAVAFSKPIRLICSPILRPERERIIERGVSVWLPRSIRYATSLRYPVDEAVRTSAAFVQRLARRTRIVQGGRLRVYLAYAVVAVIAALVVAR